MLMKQNGGYQGCRDKLFLYSTLNKEYINSLSSIQLSEYIHAYKKHPVCNGSDINNVEMSLINNMNEYCSMMVFLNNPDYELLLQTIIN